jgi:hypothetical protein
MIKGLKKENIVGKVFYGEVVDNDDPEQEGRCKVKVYGVYESDDPVYVKQADGTTKVSGSKKVEIPAEDLPWASPGSSKVFGGGDDHGFGDISIPKIGAIVRVQFAEGDLYNPEWYSIAYMNQAVKDEIADSYLNSHVILYDVDEELKAFYTPSKGFEIYLKKSHITINPDASITIEHADSQSIIELVGADCNITTQANVNVTAATKIECTTETAIFNGTTKTQLGPLGNYGAVGAEPLWAFLKSLSAAVDLKWPPSPGVNSGAAAAAEVASTSKNNKVSVP